jgi:hypothetical protein
MSKIFGGVVNTMLVVVGIVGALSEPAVASPECMTQQEARKAFPHDHLYWHTLKRCWDNVGPARNAAAAKNGGVASYAKATKPDIKPAAPPAEQQPASQSAGNASDAASDASAQPITITQPITTPPVPFTSGEMHGGLFWPVLDESGNNSEPRVQEAEALQPASQPQEAASTSSEENIVFGAPNAPPKSPEYLLEHCCWPKHVAAASESRPMVHLAAAAGGASGLAIGFWLFVNRRRKRGRRHAALYFGIRDVAMNAADMIATAAETAIAKAMARVRFLAPARVRAMRTSVQRSLSALRDRSAY